MSKPAQTTTERLNFKSAGAKRKHPADCLCHRCCSAAFNGEPRPEQPADSRDLLPPVTLR